MERSNSGQITGRAIRTKDMVRRPTPERGAGRRPANLLSYDVLAVDVPGMSVPHVGCDDRP